MGLHHVLHKLQGLIGVDELGEIISFKLSINMLNQLDRECERIGKKRSRVLRALVYLFLNDKQVHDKVVKLVHKVMI